MGSFQGGLTDRKRVVILDFGSQYTKVIARRIREHQVYSEVISHKATAAQLDNENVEAIILSGGPNSVFGKDAPQLDPDILKLGKPILGICYGLFSLLHHTGGKISPGNQGEYGPGTLSINGGGPLFDGLSGDIPVWMSHGDKVDDLTDEWILTGVSENGIVAAVQHKSLPFYGTQFHPEVQHTPDGGTILSNFLFKISNCVPDWTASHQVELLSKRIREQVGDRRVICGLSGGVDSSVVATLLTRVLGDQVDCVFIDHGLLRKNEGEQVKKFLADDLGLHVHLYDCSEQFLGKLAGVVDPEQKRKIIGAEFIEAFKASMKDLGDADFLAQGTLYPDVIESGDIAGVSHTIKSHHNVGGLPEELGLELVEPVRELFKDEVRALGRELGMPERVIMRHPFPGPGLAVRIIGDVTMERADILREADAIYQEVLRETGEYHKIWQAFAVLVPVKTVGVMGDQRTYENLLALRAVTSTDGMTADWYRMPNDVLATISNRIINEVSGINRVVYDISSKPPATIEWE